MKYRSIEAATSISASIILIYCVDVLPNLRSNDFHYFDSAAIGLILFIYCPWARYIAKRMYSF